MKSTTKSILKSCVLYLILFTITLLIGEQYNLDASIDWVKIPLIVISGFVITILVDNAIEIPINGFNREYIRSNNFYKLIIIYLFFYTLLLISYPVVLHYWHINRISENTSEAMFPIAILGSFTIAIFIGIIIDINKMVHFFKTETKKYVLKVIILKMKCFLKDLRPFIILSIPFGVLIVHQYHHIVKPAIYASTFPTVITKIYSELNIEEHNCDSVIDIAPLVTVHNSKFINNITVSCISTDSVEHLFYFAPSKKLISYHIRDTYIDQNGVIYSNYSRKVIETYDDRVHLDSIGTVEDLLSSTVVE